MTTSPTYVTSILPSGDLDRLRLAMAGYLARFKGQSRRPTESDLRSYLRWCIEQGFDPLVGTRAHIELFLRWMQERRSYAASTVSRRMSVVAGFYAPVSSTASSSTHQPTASADPTCRPSHRRWA